MDDEIRLEKPPREPKIDLVIGILITFALLILDILELVPLVGDVTSVLAFGLNFYLSSKGINGTVFIVGNTLDFIPVVQEFPCKTIGWLITWGIDHFAPAAVSEAVEKVGEKASAARGVAAGEGGAASASKAAAPGTAATGAASSESIAGGVNSTEKAQVPGSKSTPSGEGSTTTGGKSEGEAGSRALGEREEALDRLKKAMETLPDQDNRGRAEEGGYGWEGAEENKQETVPHPNIIDLRNRENREEGEEEERLAA